MIKKLSKDHIKLMREIDKIELTLDQYRQIMFESELYLKYLRNHYSILLKEIQQYFADQEAEDEEVSDDD